MTFTAVIIVDIHADNEDDASDMAHQLTKELISNASVQDAYVDDLFTEED